MTPTQAIDFTTPRGRRAVFEVRPDTTDWMTVNACCTEDEYGLGASAWTGIALDVGAHIGGVSVMLAIDNPTLSVVAIEALPENAALCGANAIKNGVDDRVTVLQAGAGCETVAYGSTETAFAAAHRYIANGDWQTVPEARRLRVPPLSLSDLVGWHGPFSLLKIDCEGCEWSFLDDPAVAEVAEIRGEYHPRDGHGPARLRELLEPTHIVHCDDGAPFGPFRAVRR